jgi:signal transduction histidine kinase
MTLLRRSMAWGIGLSPWRKGNLKQLQLRPSQTSPLGALTLKLLLSYLGVMVAVLGLSASVVYQFFAYSLAQKLDLHLLTVAQAASHNFAAVQRNPAAAKHKQPVSIDQDGDLDLPWQDLVQSKDTVEWFDSAGRRLSVAGHSMPQQPFRYQSQPLQQSNTRSLIIAVGKNQHPEGYVRVSANTHEGEEDLHRLLLGLGIGGTVAIALVGVSGWWLTQRSLQPIERSIEKLQQFTADAAHELRSPITAIKTAVEVIQSHPERVHSADVRKLIIMNQATQHMTYLIDDLLLLASADNETIRKAESLTLISLHELLARLAEESQLKAASHGLKLHTDLHEKAWVLGNTVQLSRVFLNLLDNAIKYTASGGSIELALSQSDGSVAVGVSDTGVGIQPAQLPKVFDRFWRAEQSRSRGTGGTGLGLAIAQAIVKAHHGKITVKSELGSGSCFRVELPSGVLKKGRS